MSAHLIALAGNPNAGKTSLFNTITGARQHVANYPGVTVERKEGFYKQNGHELHLVDLPGTYSLTAYSMEELVARNVLVSERPRVVVNIVDASNIERNLYLTVQLLELGIPIIIALNMVDVAEGRGIEIDADALSARLDAPVIPTVARTGKGREELMEATIAIAEKQAGRSPLRISYGADIDPVLAKMENSITAAAFLTDFHPPRWTALKYMESDEEIIKKGRSANPSLSSRLEKMVRQVTDHLQRTLDAYPEAVIADHRYGFISALLKSGVMRRQHDADRLYLSDKLDRVLTNRFFGPLIMAAAVYLLYLFSFSMSEIPVAWLENGFAALSGFVETTMPPGHLRSLITSGIIDGVGGILGFVPIIIFMFMGIAFLEDSGYLARAAFMLDRVFRVFGLHGNSFMAFILGGGIAGGCAVPAVMATRTLRSSKERIATILTVPFMNCGAKLPVFALLIAAFFQENEAQMMFLITILSWGIALFVAKLLRSTILQGPSMPFLLELPPYRLPTFRGLLIHTWERAWMYVRKAGTTLLAVSILLWALMNFPELPEAETMMFQQQRENIVSALPEDMREKALAGKMEESDSSTEFNDVADELQKIDHAEAQASLRWSAAGRVGTALESVTQWCGFDWRTNVALVGGFAAKEVVVSTLGTAYSLGEVDPEDDASLSDLLARDPAWNPLVAFTLIVFSMIYTPCIVSVVCLAKEAGGWKWGVFSMVFNTTAAFLIAVAVYQCGRLLGIGA
ncbi:MAG: ferrous iron transport protein B [Syntrophobacteraceae bacterium]